ncbi:dual specificity protein phosphatase 16 [Kryptolebias marmoratus]|uniref:protein-tyrosine-phosphatase n=1 Tax=Kryptolebias marmoratus TaxID=37003 RepID=A0A3Q3BEC9_KRYMA|nr:dual specificity protein phosphatase 16 [Kryptolebias marmoratus]
MVWSRDGDAERPPLSVILPGLYLGAESDVTQERLASLGISYILSVSRCSPQPSFLPCSRYLRIPIDDSLWDDLLPWIPQALHFIDAAISSGASVLVHCAAGISRSPALAVAYIMYNLEMDLDHAYRFVKERRPSISPNFNFLGQLQHFQGTLSQKASGRDVFTHQRDSHLPSDTSHHEDTTRQRGSLTDESGTKQQEQWTICSNPQCIQKPASVSCEPTKPAAKPTQLQLPAGSASLVEKRKCLTLSLMPLGTCPPPSKSLQLGDSTGPAAVSVHGWEKRGQPEAKTRNSSVPCRPAEEAHREQGLLSPLSITLNKLLDWGERVLLGAGFVHPVKVGRLVLPYKC